MKPLFWALLAGGAALTLASASLGSTDPRAPGSSPAIITIGNRRYEFVRLPDGGHTFKSYRSGELMTSTTMRADGTSEAASPISQKPVAEQILWAQTMMADLSSRPVEFTNLVGPEVFQSMLDGLGKTVVRLLNSLNPNP